MNFPIDQTLDVLELGRVIALSSYDISTHYMDFEEYQILCAQIALEEEYWKDKDICPLSGKVADYYVRWAAPYNEIPYNEYSWKVNRRYYYYEADIEDLKLFQLAVYYQTEENPDESYLNESLTAYSNRNRGRRFSNKSEPLTTDAINPNYYTWHPVTDCKDISQEFGGNLAQAIQYIWRSGCPGNTKSEDVTEDLKKAIRFLEFEIERVQKSTD